MASITFYGATGTVTGSRHLLEIDGRKFLVDCGLFQGTKDNRRRNWQHFPEPAAMLDAVLLTHAHLDHAGWLPKLVAEGFRGPVYCTTATRELCDILLMDSAHLQEEDAKYANKRKFTKHKPARPLYTSEDASSALSLFHDMHYGDHLSLLPGVRVKFRDAGHILGSAFVDIKRDVGGRSRKILFTGDIGRPLRPVLRDPCQVYNVDYLVLESTYGDRLHDPDTNHDELAAIINESVARGGTLLIPAFAVGRTQTLLYAIRELEEEGKIPVLPVFVDSPMAIEAIDIFRKHIPDLNLFNRKLALENRKLFHPKKLKICRSVDESKSINEHRGPGIIISASGMVTGGRILHHMVLRLPDPATTVLFIGYQAAGTRGRTLLNGRPSVKIHGRQIPVQATIRSITGYSGHADYEEILAWLMGLNRPPEKIFIVHGEPEASNAMARHIRNRFGWKVVVPELGQRFDLDL